MSSEEPAVWTEGSSARYRSLSRVISPNRDEQIATVLCLAPFARDQELRVADLGCGQAPFLYAFLDYFPNALGLGLDLSPQMRLAATRNLSRFGERAQVVDFDLRANDWRRLIEGFDCVTSGLCVHHLDGAGKQQLFRDVHAGLQVGGALLIADLIEPASRRAQDLYGAHWDHLVRAEVARDGESEDLLETFEREGWNHFHRPSPVDHPSPLADQLGWLRAAGFEDADCFWLRSGHAVFGGFKSGRGAGQKRLQDSATLFADALRSAERALDATART